MKGKLDLKKELDYINRKSYPAYKSLAGEYDFKDYVLSIDHVQGDPFAAPSHLTIRVNQQLAGFPEEYRKDEVTTTALCDFLLRAFGQEVAKFSRQAKGSGKSGVISVTRPGQEVLRRSSCTMDAKFVYVRFLVGFPANGRTINSGELARILFDYLPVCVERALYYRNVRKDALKSCIQLAEDQQALRAFLAENDYVAFVANGSVLPRTSGVSQLPMKGALPFTSPKEMEIEVTLPHEGSIRGMGIRRGITLIAGGGYHGKSTLLQALERGVYNHVRNDGREFVITDETALKIRAEDGRIINDVDISLFINNLPNNKSTVSFSTVDASGSTSQAANIMEGIEAGSRVFLIDEDTSATNFMVRDALMQQIIARDKEPITPFLERATDLYEKAGISTILVVGSCGSYFYAADRIIQMDNYRPLDITKQVKEAISKLDPPATTAPNFHVPEFRRKVTFKDGTRTRKNYRGNGTVTEKLKTRTNGLDSLSLGNDEVNLRHLEQLVDQEQVSTLAAILKVTVEHFANREASLAQVVEFIEKQLLSKGFQALGNGKYLNGGLAETRIQEIYGVLNRFPFSL